MPCYADGAEPQYTLMISSAKLGASLEALAEQTGLQLLFPYDLAETEGIQPLNGEYSAYEALTIMLEGTGFSFGLTDRGVITISPFVGNGLNEEEAMRLNARKQTLLSSLSLFLAGASGAWAGDAAEAKEDAFVLEEIIVTATKRAESLQDIPVAITALTPDSIEKQGIESFEDFARQVPGLNLSQGTKNTGNFSIRGLNALAVAAGDQQNAVAVYIDEVPVTTNGPQTPDLRLFDVERVEVLRGPQGTLFGSGTLAGAIRIITKKADVTGFDAAVSVDYGLTGSDSFRQRYNAMVNVPLVDDKLAVRLVGYYRDEEGYIDNIGIGVENSNTEVSWGGRASLRWQPSDRFTSTFMVMHEDTKPKDASQFGPT